MSQGQFLNSIKSITDNKNCVADKFNGLYHIRGIACEWIKDGKICGGGSFLQSLDHINSTMFFGVKHPKLWVGFRNVCRLKKWQVNSF